MSSSTIHCPGSPMRRAWRSRHGMRSNRPRRSASRRVGGSSLWYIACSATESKGERGGDAMTVKSTSVATLVLALGLQFGGAALAQSSSSSQDDSKIKKAANEVGDKTEDVKDQTVKTSKKVGNEVGDKAEDVKDKTVKTSKKVGNEVGDKAEDAKDETVKASKKTGNWFARMWKKVF